ncbi:MAG: heme lyase CcmF/NrfE family subunit [Desulfovibrionaceae bacterium]|nr:heme lyase CcmF/NrfE family subunit [Desulfovibrionaceae bacterium]
MHLSAYLGLLFSLLASLFMAALACVAVLRGAERSLALIERVQLLATGFMVLSSLILLGALGLRDYSFLYVFEHVDNVLPMVYVLTGFWAGQEGSLLFWTLAMGAMASVFAFSESYRCLAPRTRLFFWIFFLCCQAFFLLLLTCWTNPFIQAAPAQFDGRGLNPLLQNPAMVFHPPLLFLGFAGFAVPACVALASAIAGEERSWIKVCRNWNLWAWMFLTAGIILGGWWSYMELGWGGYWAWDPVENASLIPWLSATAFLHTAVIETRRAALQRTNVLLMSLTFLLCVFSTYLTRSGVIQSLHAFGGAGVGLPLLVFLFAASVLSALAVLLGEKHLARRGLSGFVSRQGLLVASAWVFLALGLVIGLGTMWPVISSMWSPSPLGLEAGFYNRVCLPLFGLLVFLYAVCPWFHWKDGLGDKRGLYACLGLFAVAVAAFAAFGMHRPLALFTASAAVAAMAGALLAPVFNPALRTQRRAWGVCFLHLGLALMALGVAFSGPYKLERELVLRPGQTGQVGDYSFMYLDTVQRSSQAMVQAIATLEVSRDGRFIGRLLPERRMYRNFDQPFAEVSVIPGLGDEIYATLLGIDQDAAAGFKVSVNPLVNWIWIGGTILCLAPVMLLKRRGWA